MMFYQKNIQTPRLQATDKAFSLSDFSSDKTTGNGFLFPEKCINFRLFNGALRGGIGTEALFLKNPLQGYELEGAWLFCGIDQTQHLLFSTPAGVYALPLQGDKGETSPVFLSAQTFVTPPHASRYVNENNQALLLLFAQEGVFSYDGNNFVLLQNSPAVSTGCVYYDRIFCVSAQIPYRIYFSAPLEINNFTPAYRAGGYVDLSPEHGGVHALLALDKSLYALRDEGITRLYAEGENVNFTALPVDSAFGKVQKNSVQKVGSRMVFLTDEGLYSFEGGSGEVKKTANYLLNGGALAKDPSCRSCVYGRYYVLNYQISTGERYTLFFDPKTEEGWLSDIQFSHPAHFASHCYFLDGGQIATFTKKSVRLGEGMKKIWKSGYTYMNMGAGRKLLSRLTLQGNGNLQLTIQGQHACDKRVYTLNVNGEVTVRPLLKSKGFSLCIESEDVNCQIKRISVTLAVLKEG